MGPSLVNIVLVLSALIVVHEAGHFAVAKWIGVRVERFSIGFGPKLLGVTWRETEYWISVVPFGGYIKLAGEGGPARGGAPWEYLSKGVGQRCCIILAGPLMNYLLAFVIMAGLLISQPVFTARIGQVVEGYPGAAAGLQPGDRILAIDGQPVVFWDEVTERIRPRVEQPVRLELERAGERLALTVVPRAEQEPGLGRTLAVGRIGIQPSDERQRHPPAQAVWRAARQLGMFTLLTLRAFGLMVVGQLSVRELTGPIGILVLTHEATQVNFATVLQLAGVFSASLAIFNLLPIPVLDGGHLLFLAIEKLRGRPVSDRVQERAANVGLALFLVLLVLVSVGDVQRYGVWEKISSLFQ